jgi:type II secretory ATPase GspE/PulE/Tfp pilus assembly ATPase PilB-like protein/CheY-like chemotaxis protein
VLTVAMANPADFDAMQDIEFASGLRIRAVVASRTEVLDGISTHYNTEEKLDEFLAGVADPNDISVEAASDDEEGGPPDLDSAAGAEADAAPVVKMCNLIIRDAIKMKASDIHIEALVNGVLVRFRIDGVLRDYMQIPKWLHNPLVSRLKILAKLDIAERRVPQDGRLKVQALGKPIDLRLSTLPTHFGEKVVMRLLGSSAVPTFEKMGYSAEQIQILENALNTPQGLILVTGPTGSGKSTTLYSGVDRKKSPEVNIITVEDPMQVNVKAGLTFAAALRSILRQDPDVILVGEIRDLETAEIAFHAAMTGHLVLSTLHTNSTVATIGRLLDMGVDPALITSSVILITAQRLARRICLNCKEEYQPDALLLERLRIAEKEMKFYRGKGCDGCGQTGFSGRIGIYEILRMTPSVKELIGKKAEEADIRKAAGLAGTRFLLEDAMEKVRSGITTLEEIMRVVQLQEDEIVRCPSCSAFINRDFASCPYCLHQFKHLCKGCGQELKLEWRICPYCNARAEVTIAPPDEQQRRAAAAAAAGISVTSEPETTHAAHAHPAPRVNASQSSPAKDHLEPVAPVSTERKKPRILVVDDDDGIKVIVKKALKQLPVDVDVVTASDGQDALHQVGKKLPDMVITDVMMPRMDGFSLCENLRGDVRTAFIPIMMLTANADESARTRGYMIGTDDYMNKPFSVPDLNARVMRLLRRTYGL